MAQDLNPTDALRESLRHLGDEFKRDQLAYLSLTAKNEQPLCGALAYRLHKKFAGDAEVTIVREWSRKGHERRFFDIAVLPNRNSIEPIALIEAKAAMAFDPLQNLGGRRSEKKARVYPSKEVAKDAEKLRNFEGVNQRFLLVFFTTYDGLPNEGHPAIKYMPGIKGHHDKHGPHEKHSFICKGLPRFRKAVRCRIPSVKRVHEGEICAGKAFGVTVSVHWLLMELK